MPSRETLRTIDASLNRIGEGLRVLEEYARFALNDAALTQPLKNMRHALVRLAPVLQVQLINARNAAGDVGAAMDVPGEDSRHDSQGSIEANARRVQESLRVMEELARDADLDLDTNKYKHARFALYTIEKELLAKMLRRDKIKRLSGLYIIIDAAFLKGRRPADIAAQAIRGGANIIQLRAKERSTRDFLLAAQEIREVCAARHALFIVNDSLEVALACDADGLHVGQDDLPVAVARRLLPIDRILGCSALTLAEARAARDAGADYLGIGAIFATATKDAAGATGTDIIGEIKKVVALPVVAIGGINRSNIKSVMAAGADSAAVISAVMSADNVEAATRRLVKIIEGVKIG